MTRNDTKKGREQNDSNYNVLAGHCKPCLQTNTV